MDVVTHGLASYALTKAAFPRVSAITITGVILAGIAANADELSVEFGPAEFLHWHRTFLHSITAAICIAIIVCVAVIGASRNKPRRDAALTIFIAAFAASLLHVLMDLAQNESVEALWPFRPRRYSADLVTNFDLWILLILLAGVLLPILFRLVNEEIGAKSKSPQGRVGAMVALLLLGAYFATRFVLHANALTILDAHTYQDELPKKVAAFAEGASPLRWRGIVETERALIDLELNLAPGSSFNPNAGFTSYKPEMSPALQAAQHTQTVQAFLQAARFPKASVEKTESGYRVLVRDFAYQRDIDAGLRVMAVVELDATGKVTSQEFAWARRF